MEVGFDQIRPRFNRQHQEFAAGVDGDRGSLLFEKGREVALNGRINTRRQASGQQIPIRVKGRDGLLQRLQILRGWRCSGKIDVGCLLRDGVRNLDARPRRPGNT